LAPNASIYQENTAINSKNTNARHKTPKNNNPTQSPETPLNVLLPIVRRVDLLPAKKLCV
jgi:hypothetical protein